MCQNPDPISPINGAGNEFNTFTAGHAEGVKYYENYDKVNLGVAEYETLKTVEPHKDSAGVLSEQDENNPSSVCVTGDVDVHYFGEVTIWVYLEGWDHAITDEEIDHAFNLSLTFEINKLGVES